MNHLITDEFLIEIYHTAVELKDIDQDFLEMLKEEMERRDLLSQTISQLKKGFEYDQARSAKRNL